MKNRLSKVQKSALLSFAVTVVMAWLMHWEAGDLMWGIWASSATYGLVYGIVLILKNPGEVDAGDGTDKGRLLLVLAFFTGVYGIFHYGQGIFLSVVFPITPMEGWALFLYPLTAFHWYWGVIVITFYSRWSELLGATKPSDDPQRILEPFKNVVKMQVLVFVFMFLEAGGLIRFAVYPVLVFYFFPFTLFREKLKSWFEKLAVFMNRINIGRQDIYNRIDRTLGGFSISFPKAAKRDRKTTRAELENVYGRFIQGIENCDGKALQSVLWFDRSDQNVVIDMKDLASQPRLGCEYMQSLHPKLSDTTYIEHRVFETRDTDAEGEGTAYYYFVWRPPVRQTWVQFVQKMIPEPGINDGKTVVTYRRFIKEGGQWKLDFNEYMTPSPLFEQPMENVDSGNVQKLATRTIAQWLLPEEDLSTRKFSPLRFLRIGNLINILFLAIPLLLFYAAWHDYRISGQVENWPTTKGRVVTSDNRGNFAYEYQVHGRRYTSGALDFADLVARCHSENGKHASMDACAGERTWLGWIRKDSYYAYSDEQINEAIASITSRQRYVELKNEDMGARFLTIKQRAYDIASYFEGDSVTVRYDPENPAAAVLSACVVPRGYWFLDYKQTLILFAGISVFLLVVGLCSMLNLPNWAVKLIVFAVAIGFIWYWAFGPGKQDEKPPPEPNTQYSQMAPVSDPSWQTTEGNIYLSFFDSRLKGKNMQSISKVVYRYTVDGERYIGIYREDYWDAADTYRENAKVEVHYMASDPSVSRLGKVIQ